MTSLPHGPTPPARADRPRIQDLAGAVLAGADTEELLDLLVGSARTDLAVRTAALVMPLDTGTWVHEIVDGPDAPQLLGASIDPPSALGRALSDADAEAIEAIGALDLGSGPGEDTADHRRALFAVIDAASHGNGCLGVLSDPGSEQPFTPADRERLDSLAGLIALTLLGRALSDADAEAIEAIGALDLGSGPGEDTADHRRALFAVIDAASHGNGCLGVLSDPGSEQPFTPADRERLDSLAGLIALTLRGPTVEDCTEVDDERSRI